MLKIKRHYDRLKEKNIAIESIYMREGMDTKLIRSSDGLRNDTVYNSHLVEKRYFYKNKCIFLENNFNNNFNYTIKTISKNKKLECPNCGYNGLIYNFYDGCPYCGTNFNIDLKNKQSNFSNFNDAFKEKPAWILVLTIMFIILILNIVFSGTKFPYYFLYLIFLPFYFFQSLVISSLIIFIAIPFIELFKQTNISFKLMKNYEKIISDFNFSLLNYYYNNSKYNDVIDFNITRYYSIKNKNNDKVKIKYNINEYYLVNKEIIKKNKKKCAILSKNLNKIETKFSNIHKCINCGSNLDLLENECEHCGTSIPKINDWLLEKIID